MTRQLPHNISVPHQDLHVNMPPSPCATCDEARAVIIRPKNRQKLCKECFIRVFEAEVHQTIISNSLFSRGERVAIGASGGKDSTVLASVLKTLNQRHDYGLDLVLLSIDEGIKGYRDDSLETVKRNAIQYAMPLQIVGYGELYGWTMDQVVSQIGKKGNCTYCGVFRRQALDRGAAMLGIKHVVTGHNADDIAETVMMNLLRGDLPRLARATSIVTASPASDIKRSKPLKYAYEKEIVLYAHHKKLDYFTPECIYSPEAFRGSARTLIKNLERVNPRTILDVVKSGEDMAKLVPSEFGGPSFSDSLPVEVDDESAGGCGSAHGRNTASDMTAMEKHRRQNEHIENQEIDFTLTGQRHDRQRANPGKKAIRETPRQQIGKCSKCGYMSSQAICKACTLLDGLNKNRPKTRVGCGDDDGNPLATIADSVTVAPDQ